MILQDSYSILQVYYDIFVRHAFGNYRDILREVAFSPLMAEMLSFKYNKSTLSVWKKRNVLQYADENFAREVMQLFSIGLVQLFNDGTTIRDANGQAIETYTNDDITEYARLWTGFFPQRNRGNLEDATESIRDNFVDPMRIDRTTRDPYPKMGLNGKYIGDGYPLCRDLPDRHFLIQGATYRLLGGNSRPIMLREHPSLSTTLKDRTQRFLLPSDSDLKRQFCLNQEGGNCTYPSKVVLDRDLICKGHECSIHSPRVIEVEPGLYYEYLRPPCVHQAFYNDAIVTARRVFRSCGDPRLPIAATGCCDKKTGLKVEDRWYLEFDGERLTMSQMQERCELFGLKPCAPAFVSCNGCDAEMPYWHPNDSCLTKVKINRDGRIAMVHELASLPGNAKMEVEISSDTKTYFRAAWQGNAVFDNLLSGSFDNNCVVIGCSMTEDLQCECPANVEEALVFQSAPTRHEVLGQLYAGAFRLQENDRSFVSMTVSPGVRMHSLDGEYSIDSIFEVVDDNGVVQLRKNMRSLVQVGNSKSLRFRNPVHFIETTYPELRDIHYETEAGLDHYFVSRFWFERALAVPNLLTAIMLLFLLPVSSQCRPLSGLSSRPEIWYLQSFASICRSDGICVSNRYIRSV